MKKKLLVTLLAIVSVFACAFGVSACAVKPSDKGGDGSTTCNHSYEYISFDKNNHTCICSKCGDTYNQSHSFNSNNVCSKCGEIKDTGSGTGDDNPSQKKTVSLNPNGGKLNKSEEIQTQDFEVGKLMKDLPTPTRDGYTFICWEEYPFGDEYTAASLMPNRTLQLRAKWEKKVDDFFDEYVTFKPATRGKKHSDIFYASYEGIQEYVYVELTSDDLGGINRVGVNNNLDLAQSGEIFDYSVGKNYTLLWYSGSWNNPNGAQMFTLNYGSNIQLLTVSEGQRVLKRYLVDIYVKHDYYISLYSNIFESEPYDKVRVIENERFSATTNTKEEKGFEFNKRVYYNQETLNYEEFDYSTAITKDLKLYQTYKPVTIEAELNEGTLADSLVITPYTQYFTLPSAEKEGYDFLGWKLENGNYLTNIEGFAGRKYIASKTNIDKPEIIAMPKKLTAVYAEKKYYYSFKNDTLKTVKTIPVVTYTNDLMTDILEIIYTPYNMDCVLPKKVVRNGNLLFTGWGNYAFNSSTGEYNHSLSPYFDFENKVTKPLALIPESVISYYTEILPLNEERTFTRTTTYEMYFPASKSYNLTISTTGSVTFKLTTSTGNSTNVRTVTVSSSTPQTLNVYNYKYTAGSQIITGGRATLEVTSLRGSFTTNLVGDTTNTVGSPIETNDSNTVKVGEEFTVSLTKSGYTFVGWYEGNKKVSDTEFISMEDRERTLTAKWVSCLITLEKSIEEAGTVGGIPATTVVGEEVTITAATKAGYTWIGWYEGETKLTNALSYTFNMPAESTTYTAKWIKVTIEKNLSDAGTVSSLASIYNVGDEVTITATTNSGYTWVGWYNGAEELTKNLSYTFNMPEESATYTAKWAKVTLARSNSSAGSVAFTTPGSNFTAGQEVTIAATTNSGYTWVGWYNGAEELTKNLSYTFNMPSEDVIYTAKWTYFTLTTTTNDLSAGSVTSKNNTKTTAGEEVTITATTNLGYTWLGWYDGETELTKELSYTFTMPAENVIKIAKWKVAEEMQNFDFTSTQTTCNIKGLKNINVTQITVPEYVTSISGSAFKQCSGLISVDWNAENCTKVGGSYAIGDEPIFAYCKKLTTITIANNVKIIPDYAFRDCSGLESVTIGNSVTSIGRYAFSGCSSLTIITIPDSVTSIGEYAFYNCSGLESVTIGNGVKSIGSYAFNNCKGLTAVTIPDGVTSIGSSAFYDCSGLNSITIPDSVTSIGNNAFGRCSGLTQKVNGVSYVDKWVIDCDTSVTTVTLRSDTRGIASSAFEDCSGLKSITIPDSVISIGSYAFEDCSALTNVTIGNGVTSIGYGAFRNCSGLYSITIPDSVKSIGGYAFYGCSKLSSIDLGKGVTSIGEAAFRDCSLISVTLPDSVTSIGDAAFVYCRALKYIRIPNGVTSIGDSMFSGCSGLTTIKFDGTKAQWESITKGSNWNASTGNYTIQCDDGNITKS